MQIVIDIPSEMYDWFNTGFPNEEDFEKLWAIVKDGIILPNHGRLGDLDKLLEEANKDGAYGYASAREIQAFPTVIKANTIEGDEWVDEVVAQMKDKKLRVLSSIEIGE